jgi:N-acetylglutamate synthase-like GNAT family acetyltransferase
MEISIRQAKVDDLSAIKQLYQLWGYKGELAAEDQIFIATWQEQVVGVVRISFENGNYVLRGMYVKSDFQRQGIGSLLLRTANDWLRQRKCFCVPFASLRHFYEQIGFEEVEDKDAPDFLVIRSNRYKSDGHDIIIMCRQGG